MQKVLRKRIGRDLKENLFRYLALGFLIMTGMYIIVSLIGAGVTIIQKGNEHDRVNNVESGQFEVFLPLTDTQVVQIEKAGAEIEPMFYEDYAVGEDKVLRVFKNRRTIDRIECTEGRLAEKVDEIVLERRFSEENNISCGTVITIAGYDFTVTGIGTTPDYNAPFKELSDSVVDSKKFGTAFVSEEAYERLDASGKSSKAETYLYAFVCKKDASCDDIRTAVKEIKVDTDKITDPLFQEYWDRTGAVFDEFTNGAQELEDGSAELKDGLDEIAENNDALNKAADRLLQAYLKQANTSLKENGLEAALTEDNFETQLKKWSDEYGGLMALSLSNLRVSLQEIKKFKDGLSEYTDGVQDAADGAGSLADGMQDMKAQIEEYLTENNIELPNLTSFLEADNNARIGGSADDQQINVKCGYFFGVLLMMLFAYVISVFVVHGIEKESSVIGALYALGVRRQDLMLHYLTLPVCVTVIAGLAGFFLGISSVGIPAQMQDVYSYYSVPDLEILIPPSLILYGVIMPPLSAVIVNYFVIQKKLSGTALSLLRNEAKQPKGSRIRLGDMGFIGRFRARQMLREFRTAMTVVLGMFFSMICLMLSLDTAVLCEKVKENNVKDTRYEYMYLYKYPTETPPAGGEEAYMTTLKKEIMGYNWDINVLGLKDATKYFDVELPREKNRVVISSALSQKYGLKAGDELVLHEEENDMDYAFLVESITEYAPAFYVFMNIDAARDLFDAQEDAFNVVFADHELSVDAGRLYSVVTRKDIESAAGIFADLMRSMVIMIVVVATLIFIVVMYLMMKVMIERSSFSISLMKVFGFRKKEIRKLYLDGNFFVVAIGAAVCMPLSKWIMDLAFPFMVSNVNCGIDLHFSAPLWIGLYASILLLYAIINFALTRRLDKIVPAEVLKNRE